MGLRLKVVMKPTPSSSNIDAIGYLRASRQLFVRFKYGRTYAYQHVAPAIFDDLKSASSKGGFFSRYIKNVFAATDVTGSNEVEFMDVGENEFVSPLARLLETHDAEKHDARWRW